MAKKNNWFLFDDDEEKKKIKESNSGAIIKTKSDESSAAAKSAATSTRNRKQNIDIPKVSSYPIKSTSSARDDAARKSTRKRTDNIDKPVSSSNTKNTNTKSSTDEKKPSAVDMLYFSESSKANRDALNSPEKKDNRESKVVDWTRSSVTGLQFSENSIANRKALGIDDDSEKKESTVQAEKPKSVNEYISDAANKRFIAATFPGYKTREQKQADNEFLNLVSPAEHYGPVKTPDTLKTERDITKTAFKTFLTPEREARFLRNSATEEEQNVYKDFMDRLGYYDSAILQNTRDEEEQGYVRKSNAIVSETVNKRDFNEKVEIGKRSLTGMNGKAPEETYEVLKYMTDEERNVSYYLHGTDPVKAAEFDKLFYAKMNRSKEQEAFEYGKEHPVMAGIARTAYMIPTAVTSAIYAGHNAVNALAGKDAVNPYAQGYMTANLEKDKFVEGIKENTGTIGDILIDGGFSILDSAQAAAINSFAPGLGTAMLSASGAGSSMVDTYKRGGTAGQIALAGVGSAAIEYVTENISLSHFDTLLKGKSKTEGVGFLSRLLKTAPDDSNLMKGFKIFTYGVASQAGEEAKEELISSYANTLWDCFVMQDNSEVNLMAQNYMQNGMTKSEAYKAVALDKFLKEPVVSAAMGGLTGGIMGGGATAFNLGRAMIGSPKAGSVGFDGTVNGAQIASRYITTEEAMKLLQKSGIKVSKEQAVNLKNAHNQRAELAYSIARTFGVNVRFGGVAKGALAQYEKSSNTIYLNPSEKVSTMAQLAEGHEIVHAIEQTPNYGKIANMVVEGVFGGTKSSAYISEASRIDAVYKKAGQTLTPEELKQEVVAEYFRTKVFKDSDTLKQFITENYSTLGKDFFANLHQIAGKVRHVFNEKILGKTGTSLTPSLSEQILTEFATAMNQTRRDANAQIRSDRLDSVAEGYGLLNRNGFAENSRRNMVAESGIEINMSDEPRADILKNRSIEVVTANTDGIISLSNKESVSKRMTDFKKDVKKVLDEAGFFKGFENAELKIEAEYTNRSLNKSVHSNTYTTRADFLLLMDNFENIFKNAVILDATTDKYAGTPKANPDLENAYTLVSAFRTSEGITPVQFTVKTYKQASTRTPKIYMGIALTKITDGSFEALELHNNATANAPLPSVNISIPQLIEKINPLEGHFFKHVPDSMLSEEQITSKRKAEQEDFDKYGVKPRSERQSLATESSVAELYDGSVPDEELAERARVEAAEYLEAPYDAEEEAGRTAERFKKERDSFDTVLSGIDVSKLSDKKYLQSVSGNIVKATDIYKHVRRKTDNVILGFGEEYGRIEQREVERLLSGDLDISEISSKANRRVVERVYGIMKNASDMEHVLTEIRIAAKERYKGFAKSILEHSDTFRGPSGAKTHILSPKRLLAYTTSGTKTEGRFMDELIYPMMENSASINREHSDYVKRIQDIGISKKVAKGDKLSEDAIIQCMEELRGKAEYFSKQKNYYKSKEVKSDADNKKIEECEDFIAKINSDYERLLEDNPSIEKRLPELKEKGKKVRAIYDELFDRINKVRVENGYEPIPYRHGYFIHYAKKDVGFFKQYFDIPDSESERQLSTALLGITEHFSPGMAYSQWAQSRSYDQAQEYSVLRGFDNYLGSALDVIYHTEDIQKFRALENELRDKHMSEESKKKIEQIRSREDMSFLEKAEAINDIYKDDGGKLGNLAVFFHEEGNALANKKSHMDRPFEKLLSPGDNSVTGKKKWGERAYNGFKWISKRTVSSLIAGNVSTAFSNTEALMACSNDVSATSFIKAGKDMVVATFANDGFKDSSAFLTARGGQEQLNPLWIDKIKDGSMAMMEFSDMTVSEWITRAYYNDGRKKGLTHEAAMQFADMKASDCIGDRSKGLTPLIFSANNPATSIFTKFQLEVSNRFQWLFDGMSEKKKKAGVAGIASFLLGYCLKAYLFDDLYEKLLGRKIAFDPLSIINDTAGDLTGYKLDNFTDIIQNVVSGNGFEYLETTNKVGWNKAVLNTAGNTLEQLPFLSPFTGGGRIPITAALPDFEETLSIAASEDLTPKEKWKQGAYSLLADPAALLLLPAGGNQIKKTAEGAIALMKGGHYKTGADGKRKLAYPVEASTGTEKSFAENAQAGLNAAKGLLFGKSAFDEARDWQNRGFSYLSEPATEVYDGIVKKGVQKHTAFDTVYNLNKTEGTKDENGFRIVTDAGAKREQLIKSNLSADIKNYIDRNLIQKGDEKRNIDYSQPEFVRAIEKYRDYSKDYDGATNFEHFSQGLTDRQSKALSVMSETYQGSTARRMALFNDNTLTPEQKNRFDAEWLSDIPEQKPTRELYDEVMKSEPGYTCTYESFVKTYNIMASQPSREAAIMCFVSPGEGAENKKAISMELACKVYKSMDIKHPYDYSDEEKFFLSTLTISKYSKYEDARKQAGVANAINYCHFVNVMNAAGTKKKQKIQAIVDLGFTEQQATRLYKAIN